jgi:hypothetical protein
VNHLIKTTLVGGFDFLFKTHASLTRAVHYFSSLLLTNDISLALHKNVIIFCLEPKAQLKVDFGGLPSDLSIINFFA